MIRSFSPGLSSVLTVSRAQVGPALDEVTVPSGPSTTWSMPAAIRRPLARVRCTRLTRSSL